MMQMTQTAQMMNPRAERRSEMARSPPHAQTADREARAVDGDKTRQRGRAVSLSGQMKWQRGGGEAEERRSGEAEKRRRGEAERRR